MESNFSSGFRRLPNFERLAPALKPRVEQLDVRFARRLRRSYDARQSKALAEITPGAAVRMIAAGRRVADFLEQVAYNGRRLAKLNVAPAAIMRVLDEYDRLLDPLPQKSDLAKLRPAVVLTLNNAYYQVRESEAQAFFDLFRAELEGRGLDDLLQRFARILARTFRAEAAHLYLGGDRSRRRFIEAGDRAERLILDSAWRGRYRSYWSIPFFSAGRPAGLVQLAFATRYEWLPRELELLDAVAERCLAAAEKARLTEQVHELAAHMFLVEEEERRRISRELHDEAGQSLLCARLQLEMLEKCAPQSWPERAQLAQTRQVVEHTIVEVRRILAALSPAVLEQLGLPAAIRQLTTRFRALSTARVQLRVSLGGRLPRNIETVAYRLVQECYHNIAKHSAASHVKVALRSTDGSLGLKVEDDGVGFDLDAAMAKRDSFGLTGMRERVLLMGGSFDIRSRPGGGTRIAIKLPLAHGERRHGQDSSLSNR